MDSRNIKRITIFAGHYGSGKTNVAINYALTLAKTGFKTAAADLDIVNPYFRTKDAEAVLKENGIRLIVSEFAGTNVDTPALPPEAYSLVHDSSIHAVIDVGGDDRGALALGRYAPEIAKQDNYDMFFVINKYRYLTQNSEEAIEIMNEISRAAELDFTGIINNSNLGDETTAKDILNSVEYAHEVSEMSGLEIIATAVRQDIADELENEINNIMPVRLYVKQAWQRK